MQADITALRALTIGDRASGSRIARMYVQAYLEIVQEVPKSQVTSQVDRYVKAGSPGTYEAQLTDFISGVDSPSTADVVPAYLSDFPGVQEFVSSSWATKPTGKGACDGWKALVDAVGQPTPFWSCWIGFQFVTEKTGVIACSANLVSSAISQGKSPRCSLVDHPQLGYTAVGLFKDLAPVIY